jgi:hypothetical protein
LLTPALGVAGWALPHAPLIGPVRPCAHQVTARMAVRATTRADEVPLPRGMAARLGLPPPCSRRPPARFPYFVLEVLEHRPGAFWADKAGWVKAEHLAHSCGASCAEIVGALATYAWAGRAPLLQLSPQGDRVRLAPRGTASPRLSHRRRHRIGESGVAGSSARQVSCWHTSTPGSPARTSAVSSAATHKCSGEAGAAGATTASTAVLATARGPSSEGRATACRPRVLVLGAAGILLPTLQGRHRWLFSITVAGLWRRDPATQQLGS